MTRSFKGIDFANQADANVTCYLEVENGVLKAHPDDGHEPVERTGIDCPFGISLGFWRLLTGAAPGPFHDHFKTRHTERWLRELLSGREYQANRYWRDNVHRAPQLYFNQTGHVHPAAGFQIIPGFLDWFRREIGDECFDATMKASRRGESGYVEVHPRAFLCSAIERMWRTMNWPVNRGPAECETALRAVAQYKDARNGSHRAQRECVYGLLRQHTQAWLGEGYQLAEAEKWLFATDHQFDAWLCALTAFAHAQGLTIAWPDVSITEEEINVEGHISILKQEGSLAGTVVEGS
jgi:hypothetical protein